ncbi:translocator protein 2 [Cricetulus griseus]
MGVSTLPRTGLEGRGKGGSFGARLASRSPLLTVPSAGEQRSKAASMTEEEGTFARGIRLLRRSGLTWESCSNTTAVSTGSGLETEAQRSFRESQCNRSTHREFLFSPFCMGRSHSYASYLVWKDLGGGFRWPLALPLGLYTLQLTLSWTFLMLFLTANNPGLALLDLLLLYGLVASMVLIWQPINKLAALLLLPYLAWLTVTTAITYRLWRDSLCPAYQP